MCKLNNNGINTDIDIKDGVKAKDYSVQVKEYVKVEVREPKTEIKVKVNGELIQEEVFATTTLLEFLRDTLHLYGTKLGCGDGECGACTIIMDGKAVRSCIILAPEVDGSEIITVEGLQLEDGKLHPLQEAFIETGAVQCGFCTPGMLMTAKALIDSNPNPSEEDIITAMSGHLCRCTGYKPIAEAIKHAVERMK
jgi:carbon-monoxide dehydrogenase small subunit